MDNKVKVSEPIDDDRDEEMPDELDIDWSTAWSNPYVGKTRKTPVIRSIPTEDTCLS